MLAVESTGAEALEEHRRVDLLAELGVLDTAPEAGFDALVHAASAIADCPISLVTLFDGDRVWFKARRGIDLLQSTREWSFYTDMLGPPALLEVPDASADPRFARNPFVIGEPGVRFYAGEPLVVDGIIIGTLCVIDTRPRTLDEKARNALHSLALAAAALLAERRTRIMPWEQQRRLTDFAMVSGDWLWETDAEHCVRWMASGYATHPALPEPWRLGRPMDDNPVLDVAGAPIAPPTTTHRLLDERRVFVRAIVRSDAPGGPYFLLLSAVCRRDAGGAWLGYRGVARDVRSRLKAEQARADAAAVLTELSAQVPGLIFQFRRGADGHMCFPFVSERITDLELTADELAADAGTALARCHPADVDHLLASIERSARQLTVWRETFQVVLPVHGERTYSGQARPKRLADGAVLWHGLLTDVTEQVHETERLKVLGEAQAAAEKTAQLRSEFMSRVSHELRTPLNAILGFAQLLRLNGGSQPAAQTQRAAAQIESAGTHLLSLVNDMLDLASLEAGHLNLRLQPLTLAPLVQRSLALIEPQASRNHMTFDLWADPATPSVLADARAVRQIVFNLAGNAIKYGRPNTTVHVRVQDNPADGQVLLEVIDAGPGIAADKLASLFEPFSRLRTGEDAPVGTGLGLSISRQLVSAMAGRIEVESVLGQGTTFRVRLPADGRPATAAPAAEDNPTHGDTRPADLQVERPGDGRGGARGGVAADATAAARVGAATILYIEDEPVNALLMQEFVKSLPAGGLRLVVAANGRDGMLAARQQQPNLILLDLHLPDLDGFAVLQQLLADPSTARIPVIALSADALPDQLRRARQAGFADYWTKPIDFRQVQLALLHRFPAVRPG